MAQPLGSKERQDKWRESISSSLLLKRLDDYALGNIELDRDRIKAIEILLKKTLPDLKQIEHTGEGGGPVRVLGKIELVAPKIEPTD